jgi:hypothetical protein
MKENTESLDTKVNKTTLIDSVPIGDGAVINSDTIPFSPFDSTSVKNKIEAVSSVVNILGTVETKDLLPLNPNVRDSWIVITD